METNPQQGGRPSENRLVKKCFPSGRLSPNRRQGNNPAQAPPSGPWTPWKLTPRHKTPGFEASGTKATLLPRSKDDKGCHPGVRQGWTAICKAIGGNTSNTGNDFYDEVMKLLAEIHKKAVANWAQMSAACNTASIIEKDAYRTDSFRTNSTQSGPGRTPSLSKRKNPV